MGYCKRGRYWTEGLRWQEGSTWSRRAQVTAERGIMLPRRSLLTIALGGSLLALLALPGAQAQSATAPTASIDPEALDAIWQKASSKYDGQRAALLKQVEASSHHGPFR